MTPKQMHELRIGYKPKGVRKGTPLAKEIEIRREEMIKSILGNTHHILSKQMEVASLPVTPEGKDNDTVLKASTALLDRVYGKPKESIDLSGNVQFSLKALAAQAEKMDIIKEDIKLIE